MSRKPNKSRENSAAAERLADWQSGGSYVPQGPLSLADSDSPEYENRGAFAQETMYDDMDAGIDGMSLRDVDRDKVCSYNQYLW